MMWDGFTKNAIAQQIIRAAGGIGANIAEGRGGGDCGDNKSFARIGFYRKMNETQHFLRLAYERKPIWEEEVERLKALIDEFAPDFNAYHNSIKTRAPNARQPNTWCQTPNTK